MLEFLQIPHLIQYDGNKTKCIGKPGGIADDVKERCLAHLRCWASLAVAVVRSEFPSLEILQTFSIFDLSGDRDGGVSDQRVREENATRLSKVCEVDGQAFLTQFDDVRPMAMQAYKSGNTSNVEAWRTELRRLKTGHTYVRRNHPIDALLAVFVRYAAWSGCSTSGQERVHSKQDWLFTARRRCMSADLERDEIRIVAHCTPEEQDDVLMRAQQHWTSTYGFIRKRTRRKINCGKPLAKVRADHVRTMKKWVASRRA
jgi:hypothetical protein